MLHTTRVLVGVTVAALAIGTMFILTLLNRLVFRRLEHIISVATLVVGGDYNTEIQVSSHDEVGQFEQLFEQFRRVFIDVLAHVPELQEHVQEENEPSSKEPLATGLKAAGSGV